MIVPETASVCPEKDVAGIEHPIGAEPSWPQIVSGQGQVYDWTTFAPFSDAQNPPRGSAKLIEAKENAGHEILRRRGGQKRLLKQLWTWPLKYVFSLLTGIKQRGAVVVLPNHPSRVTS